MMFEYMVSICGPENASTMTVITAITSRTMTIPTVMAKVLARLVARCSWSVIDILSIIFPLFKKDDYRIRQRAFEVDRHVSVRDRDKRTDRVVAENGARRVVVQ